MQRESKEKTEHLHLLLLGQVPCFSVQGDKDEEVGQVGGLRFENPTSAPEFGSAPTPPQSPPLGPTTRPFLPAGPVGAPQFSRGSAGRRRRRRSADAAICRRLWIRKRATEVGAQVDAVETAMRHHRGGNRGAKRRCLREIKPCVGGIRGSGST
ncbi:hypothetical protein L3X38_034423 [Prunus dulcis]|uniref:Uncharacterized protein n=1 Tax=Prunus dulcis TaxID=3755 RepID=A0AAD4VHR4_PRUDU|nr:hypothetical protein L3X38_034423 [Prunus dulcis]